jgi:hypothetical protein
VRQQLAASRRVSRELITAFRAETDIARDPADQRPRWRRLFWLPSQINALRLPAMGRK